MKHAKIRRIYLLCLAGIVLVLNNAHGFVHCQSPEDGHSRLEPISNTCCNVVNINTSSENTADSFGETFFISNDNCGSCVDTIVSVDVINADKKTVHLNSTITAIPAILNITAACYGCSGQVICSELPTLANPSLPSIRTIILLV